MHQPEVWTNPRGIAGVNLKNEILRMHHARVNVAWGGGGIWPSAGLNLALLGTRGKRAERGLKDDVMIKIAYKIICKSITYISLMNKSL